VKKSVLIMAILFAFYGSFGSALFASAGCKSDCKDQYQSEVESCNSNYDDPEDADDLKMCIDDAKDEHNKVVFREFLIPDSQQFLPFSQ
jgi:hypothetical protein